MSTVIYNPPAPNEVQWNADPESVPDFVVADSEIDHTVITTDTSDGEVEAVVS